MCSEDFLDQVLLAAVGVAITMWTMFKSMNMFDPNGIESLSFPFALTDVVGPNLVLIKDNIISTNEVNLYGRNF